MITCVAPTRKRTLLIRRWDVATDPHHISATATCEPTQDYFAAPIFDSVMDSVTFTAPTSDLVAAAKATPPSGVPVDAQVLARTGMQFVDQAALPTPKLKAVRFWGLRLASSGVSYLGITGQTARQLSVEATVAVAQATPPSTASS